MRPLVAVFALAAGLAAAVAIRRRATLPRPSTSTATPSSTSTSSTPDPYTPAADPDAWRRALPPQIAGVPVAPSTDPGRGPAKSVTTAEARIAYKILDFLKEHGAPYGVRLRVTFPGRPLVAVFAEHPPDKGKAYPHPGVGFLEATT